jgi:hypothetical protein
MPAATRSQRLADAVDRVDAAAGAYVDSVARDGCPRATERAALERLAQAVAARREVR